MSDLISRQAAINAIRGWVKKAFEDWGNAETEIRCFNAIYPLIMALPSAQPEIIRCGECMHKDKKIDYCHYLGITICERDYCSYGERKTDETD